MTNLQIKLLRSLETNKLNITKLGERKWYNYFISVEELFWARNLVDGYLIQIYSDERKREHFATYALTYDVFVSKNILQINFEID